MAKPLTVRTDELDKELDGVFFADPEAMLLNRGLPNHCRRARLLEGEGHSIRPPRKGYKALFSVRTMEDVDRESVRALRRVVDSRARSDIAEVLDARRISGDPRWIADYCNLDLQLVIAILANLNQRETGYSGL